MCLSGALMTGLVGGVAGLFVDQWLTSVGRVFHLCVYAIFGVLSLASFWFVGRAMMSRDGTNRPVSRARRPTMLQVCAAVCVVGAVVARLVLGHH
jgi:hypothetical protein